MPLIELQNLGQDLAQRTVCVKVRLGRIGNTRKVSNSQVEVDTDKSLIRVSKHLLDSKELRSIANFDGEVRRYLYDIGLVPGFVGLYQVNFQLPAEVPPDISQCAGFLGSVNTTVALAGSGSVDVGRICVAP
jgi:hypothetical protein